LKEKMERRAARIIGLVSFRPSHRAMAGLLHRASPETERPPPARLWLIATTLMKML
jgi:hypothetical protein